MTGKDKQGKILKYFLTLQQTFALICHVTKPSNVEHEVKKK